MNIKSPAEGAFKAPDPEAQGSLLGTGQEGPRVGVFVSNRVFDVLRSFTESSTKPTYLHNIPLVHYREMYFFKVKKWYLEIYRDVYGKIELKLHDWNGPVVLYANENELLVFDDITEINLNDVIEISTIRQVSEQTLVQSIGTNEIRQKIEFYFEKVRK